MTLTLLNVVIFNTVLCVVMIPSHKMIFIDASLLLCILMEILDMQDTGYATTMKGWFNTPRDCDPQVEEPLT